MSRARYPSHFYQRRPATRLTAKHRIHQLLRQDPSLTLEQLLLVVPCPRAYARIWRRNFFAAEAQPTPPEQMEEQATPA